MPQGKMGICRRGFSAIGMDFEIEVHNSRLLERIYPRAAGEF
jgi:hypothetical protein